MSSKFIACSLSKSEHRRTVMTVESITSAGLWVESVHAKGKSVSLCVYGVTHFSRRGNGDFDSEGSL